MRKDHVWDIVNTKFEIAERSKNWVMSTIGASWRNYKARLKKKYFTPYSTFEEWISMRPKSIPLHQWHTLITFWSSKEGKTRSAIGKESSKKQKIKHTTGSKGFAQVREEEQSKRPNKEEPDRVEMFQLTHTRKDGQPINEETRKVMIQLEHQSSTETVSSHRPSASNDVLARVMGRDPPGHVRMFGRGVTPSFLWGSNSALKMIEEVKKEAEDQMEMMEKRVKAEMEAKMQESLQLITNSFYMVLVQIKEKDPDIVIPDIFNSKEPSTSDVGIDDVGDDIYGDDIYGDDIYGDDIYDEI